MTDELKFPMVDDEDISLSIVEEFHELLKSHIRNDVVVVGAGPAGLACARELAGRGCRILLVERNNYLGGGFGWVGFS